MMRAPVSDLPLSLDHVSLQAGTTVILDRVDLVINRGAPTLVVGPNGSGKTTLLRLCMGLVRHQRVRRASRRKTSGRACTA